MTIADALAEVTPSLHMSEEEYERWALVHERSEWVDGKVILKMSCSDDADKLQSLIRGVIEWIVSARDLGIVYGPNFTTRIKLAKKTARRDPDVMFLATANPAPRHKTYIDGPPDLAIEIVAPESQLRDYNEKYFEYEEAGVREYWIVNPMSQTVDLFVRDTAGKFAAKSPDADGRFCSSVIDGVWFHPQDLFAEKRPTQRDLLRKIDPSLLT